MSVQIYPPANSTSQWFADNYPGRTFNANCGVIHTTEGTSWPSYGGGATAPNITARYNFSTKKLDFRQHFPIDMSSRALRNLSGGVETNTANAVQIELIGTCDPKHRVSWNGAGKTLAGKHYIYWPEAPDSALKSLAEFLYWCEKEHGIKLQGPPQSDWKSYPSSYGATSTRFTFEEWRNFYGWCGHQHVPENTHGDPGNLKFDKLIEFARQLRPVPKYAPDNPATRKPLAYSGPRPFHRTTPGYRASNSYRGIYSAKKEGYKAIDLDFHISKENTAQCTHWVFVSKEGFLRDGTTPHSATASIHNLSDESIRRLKTKDGYVIRRADEMFKKAAEYGLLVEFEAKECAKFEVHKGGFTNFRKLKKQADDAGVQIIVKTLSNLPGARERLIAAHRAGFKTMILPRGTRRIPKSWWPYIDYVRGPVYWTNN